MSEAKLNHIAGGCPTFSVIVPAFNEERFVGRCLASVLAQEYPRALVEVIVVDNGSTDRTVAICQNEGAMVLSYPGLRVGALRNRGAAAAKGEILAFLDADCAATPAWLRSAADALATEPCVTGDSYDIPANAHWIERAWFSQEHRGRRCTTLIPSGNLFVTREEFLRLGGFNENLQAGEDAEFCLRASQSLPIIADDRIRVIHHGNPKTLRQFLARESWHGMGALGSIRLSWKDKPLSGTVLFSLLTAAQIVALLFWVAGAGGGRTLIAASLGIAVLLAATVVYRLRATRNWRNFPALALLYYMYYLGRTYSLGLLLTRRENSHRTK